MPAVLGIFQTVSPGGYHHVFGQLPLLSYGDGFVGFTSNPFRISFGLIVAVSFLWPISIMEAFRRRWIRSATDLLCVDRNFRIEMNYAQGTVRQKPNHSLQ